MDPEAMKDVIRVGMILNVQRGEVTLTLNTHCVCLIEIVVDVHSRSRLWHSSSQMWWTMTRYAVLLVVCRDWRYRCQSRYG